MYTAISHTRRQKDQSRQRRFTQSTATRTPISTKTRPLGRPTKRSLHPKNTVASSQFSIRRPTRTEVGRRRMSCLPSQRRDLSSYRSSTELQKRCHPIDNFGQTAKRRCHLTSNLGQTARKAPEQDGSASRSRLSPPIKTTLTIFLLSRREKATQ